MNIFACVSPPKTKEQDDEPPQVQPVKKPEKPQRSAREASHKNKKAKGLMKLFGL